MNKKTIIGVIIAAVVVIGGIAAGVGYHHTQEEKAKAEKKAKEHLEELTKAYDAAKFQTENAILDETERTALLESVTGYEKKLDGISKADEKEFKALCKSVQEKYDASKTLLEEVVAGIGSAYPTEEGYYTEEFTASVTAMTQELNTLKDDGKYQEAYNKYNEINNAYMAYVEKVNAERAAAEEAAKKAEAEKAKQQANAKKTENNGNSNKKGSSNNNSTENVNTGNSNTTSTNTSSGLGAKYGCSDEEVANAIAQANAQNSPVKLSSGIYIAPSGWSTDQKLDWLHQNCN